MDIIKLSTIKHTNLDSMGSANVYPRWYYRLSFTNELEAQGTGIISPGSLVGITTTTQSGNSYNNYNIFRWWFKLYIRSTKL